MLKYFQKIIVLIFGQVIMNMFGYTFFVQYD